MNGLTGSYAQLRNSDIPLEERIELSRNILRNSECFLPNKNQVIVDWSCQELANIRKKRDRVKDSFKVDVQETELWKVLSDVLNDPGSEQIILRQKVLPVLFQELDEIYSSFLGKSCSESSSNAGLTQDDRVLSVFLCFKAISKNPNMSLTFFNKLENLEQYMKGILSCFLGVLLQPDVHSANFFTELYHLVIIVLHQYGTAQHQQFSQRKVFTNLCEKLLHLLLLVRTVVKDANVQDFQDLSGDEIGSAIDAVIISGLFHKDLISNYNPTAIPRKQVEPSPKKPKLVNSYDQLFDVLQSFSKGSQEGTVFEDINVRSDFVFQTISDSLPFLLENFLNANREDGKLDNTSKFSFFVELYNATCDFADSQLPEVARIEILNKMLNVIVVYDVYQIAEDNANNEPIFKWFLSLMETELLSESYEDAARRFHCLDIILKLNHKIIEQSLEIVLAKCFVKTKQGSKDINKAKIDLLCGVAETYSKLQQLENLVISLLKVFNKLGKDLCTIPVDVLTKLSRSFEHCPFNQTLSISHLFLNELKEKVQSLEQDGNTDISIEGICILFVTFLLNSSYNAADLHGLDEKKMTSLKELMENIKVSTISPLMKAFSSCKKSSQKQVGFCTLFLIHGLNSLILFLHQHNILPTSEDHYVKLLWDSKVEAYVPDETWRGLAILKKNKRLRFCMELLVVHKVRCLLLKPNFDQNEFDHMINFLYSFEDPRTIPQFSSVSWNHDPSCVNDMNYPVAHWCLVTQYAPLLIPYCKNQLQSFAEFMIGTLVLQEEEITADNLVTLHEVSEKILKDGELLSLSSLQAVVVKQFWKLLGECMSQIVGDKLSGVFNWEVLEDQGGEMQDIDGQDTARDPSEVSLQDGKIDMNKSISLAQAIANVMNDAVNSNSGKKRSKKKTGSADLSMVAQLLKILQRLLCYQFTPSNQVHCILSLLACDVLSGKVAPDDQIGPDSQTLVVRLSCREIITTLLGSLLQHRELSAWRVVDKTSLLHWLYHTILQDQIAAKTLSTSLQCEFLNASKELLRFAVILSLKSPNQATLRNIIDFNEQLVTSVTDSVNNASPGIIRSIEVLFVVVSACTEFLEQKVKNNSSLRTACSIISNAVVGLVSFTKGTFEQGESNTELEKMVMKLSGILTRAIRLVPEAELSKNEDFTDAFEAWTEIVSMLVGKILGRMGDEEDALRVSDETITLIIVLQDVFKGGPEQCNSISHELRTQILRKCLETSRIIGFPFKESVAYCATKSTEESTNSQEAVIRLIVGLLEENEGKNYTTVLDRVLEWSIEEKEASKDTLPNLVTGLSVFRDLLATKVVKQNRKELRSVTGKIVITLLGKAARNVEISSVVLEITAALVTLGSGVFYTGDLALVFQALALKTNVTSPTFARVFMAKFAILSWTLFYYPEFVYGAVHVFLPLVRELLQSLLKRMSDGKIKSEEASTLLSCVQKMSRLYQEMASHKDVFSKYSIYFLADCVHVMSTQGVPGIIRDVLVQGVHFLFDICNDDVLTKLHVYLPNNERELFRSLKEDYMKHHKFKGNA